MLGTNDSHADSVAASEFATYQADLDPVFAQWHSYTNSRGEHPKVIIATVLPFDEAENAAFLGSDWFTGANNRIATWYRPWLISESQKYGFTLVDTWSDIQKDPNWVTDLIGPDGLHPNTAGSTWLANEFAAAAVPEPGSMAIALLAMSGGLLRRRRVA
jgi:lysophospholipase L1-like esterase